MTADLEDAVRKGNDTRPLAIEVRGLVKRFNGTTAVDGVDLRVPEGAIYGILGPNGAGKTTTLRMILGIIDPDSGFRRVLGSERPHDVPRDRLSARGAGLYPAMKAYEAIGFLGALRGVPLAKGRQRGRELLEEHGLGHLAERQIRQMSKGQAQQVQVLGTLVHEPRLVIFDEPFSGLDAINQGRLEQMIRGLAAKGTTVIFSTHVIAHAERLCDEVAIIAGAACPSPGPWTRRVIVSARRCASKPVHARVHGAPLCPQTHGRRGASGCSPCPKAAWSPCCAP
jgi:ABC-2 type transport system ATP-binding protein